MEQCSESSVELDGREYGGTNCEPDLKTGCQSFQWQEIDLPSSILVDRVENGSQNSSTRGPIDSLNQGRETVAL